MATLARWNRTIQDGAGNALNATITVYKESDGLIATIYSDRAGATPKSNPFTLSSADQGYAYFHAVGGAYKVVATYGSYTQTWRYEPVGTGAEFDAGSLSGVQAPTTTVPAAVQIAEATNNGSNKLSITIPAALAADRTVTFPDQDLTIGTAAGKNTGTSGNTVPLLDGTNTWSAAQTLSADLVIGATSGGTYNGNVFFQTSDQYPTVSYRGATTVKAQFIVDVSTQALYLDAPGGVNFRDTVNGGGVNWLALNSTAATFAKPVKVPSYTVATLPSAATVGAGAKAYVTDSNTTTYNATVAGGGANKITVTSDGANWKVS